MVGSPLRMGRSTTLDSHVPSIPSIDTRTFWHKHKCIICIRRHVMYGNSVSFKAVTIPEFCTPNGCPALNRGRRRLPSVSNTYPRNGALTLTLQNFDTVPP